MKIKHFFAIAALSSLVIGCKSDDGGGTPPEQTISEQQGITVDILTAGVSDTWKISSASLTNSNGTFEISNNFNVTDDEFIFSVNGNLEWRIGHDIDTDANSADDAKLDYYRSPSNSTFSFNQDSGNELTAMNGAFALTVMDENTINGVITLDNGASMTVTLTPKLAGDYPQIPENGLVFEEVVSFQSGDLDSEANSALTGSNADNSLYIVYREDAENDGTGGAEKILKFDIDSNSFEDNVDFYGDFYTKRAHIQNDELIIIGGSRTNTYELDFSGTPTTTNTGLALSRFGSAVRDTEIYVVGGDLDEIDSDKIRKYNYDNGQLDVFSTMPGPKTHAAAEIVNNTLYVFSGRQQFVTGDPETTSYSVNLDTGATETFDISFAVHNSYTAKDENLIYVAGDLQVDADNDDNPETYDSYIGVYNASDGSFTQLTHNLDESVPYNRVFGMTTFNGKLYVLFGDAAQVQDIPNGIFPTWQLMAADLN